MSGHDDSPDRHLRAALRHAPDAQLQAPPELGRRILTAARAAVEADRPPPWWRRIFTLPPLQLGASGALAVLAFAGVITLLWRGEPPPAVAPAAMTDAVPAPEVAPMPAPVPAPVPAAQPAAPAALPAKARTRDNTLAQHQADKTARADAPTLREERAAAASAEDALAKKKAEAAVAAAPAAAPPPAPVAAAPEAAPPTATGASHDALARTATSAVAASPARAKLQAPAPAALQEPVPTMLAPGGAARAVGNASSGSSSAPPFTAVDESWPGADGAWLRELQLVVATRWQPAAVTPASGRSASYRNAGAVLRITLGGGQVLWCEGAPESRCRRASLSADEERRMLANMPP